ncbi:sugar transporter [Ruixingdingia sedimenti]|uniref:Sugar transporter n=1 Tax=Ruixingdingia sedimenti TaxID=3073604 RepID=A0ABU1FC47_9RHOB|nr:sugar transporter [Xinfangfangia sp. LG-4]MDR5654440.1 sugar transporter [Xinfangfangia sp. LG-4]
MRPRHWGIAASFLLAVVAPMLCIAFYLWVVAVDQYASTVGFSVRKEEFQSPLELLGGVGQLSGSSSSDTDILYKFVRSQELVSKIDAALDLRRIYARAWPEDPVFAYDPSGTIEDLLSYWDRAVKVYYDSGTGLLTLRVLAFTPEEAQKIAQAIFDESSRMINALSMIAREDATRYAKEELDRAVGRLTLTRQQMTEFRLRTQIVDPSADIQGQMGLLNTLQGQLAEALIELDLVRETAREGDPRILQAERRIDVIQKRIDDERRKFGVGGKGPGGEDYATLVAEFERLAVEQHFAEEAYRGAMASYDAAVADAQRKSRYLAAHINPTLAERAQYPERLIILGIAGFFLLTFWATGVLVYYSVRDRR